MIRRAHEHDPLRQGENKLVSSTLARWVIHYNPTGAPTVLFYQDLELRYLGGSAAFCVGDHDDWLGKTDEELLPVPDGAYLTRLKREVLASGHGRCDLVVGAAGGRGHYWELVLEPLRDADQQVVGLVGACIDVTAQRQMQMEKDRLEAQLRQQQAQLRQANRQLASIKAAAQKDMSRHLHDNVGASLTGLNLDLTLVLHELARETPNLSTVQGLVHDALRLVGQVSEINSRFVEELRPPHLDREGLAAALLWYVQTFQSRVEFPITLTVAPDFPRLDSLVEYELYLIAQEAIVNAAKHAQPKQVSVSLEAAAGAVRLAVVDDGVGISLAQLGEQSETAAHWGLINIVERAELIGGRCDIISQPGAGTQIVAEVRQ